MAEVKTGTLWITIFLLIIQLTKTRSNDNLQFRSSWGYICHNRQCERLKLDQSRSQVSSLEVCRLHCDGTVPGTLWPLPTGNTSIASNILSINQSAIKFQYPRQHYDHQHNEQANKEFWYENEQRFLSQIDVKKPHKNRAQTDNNGVGVLVKIYVKEVAKNKLQLYTDESYQLNGEDLGDSLLIVNIRANTIFGARHGLETLSQLIVYNVLDGSFKMPSEFNIDDRPVYKHRGLLLDTGRNYFSVESIKRTIDAMAMVKLNTFHWHIIDSQSFPLVLESQPELARLGAYSQENIYTKKDVNEILDWAKIRGVRVVPEFDAPAHVGEGWQSKDLTACFNYQPWQKYCVEPPCGQLDPSKGELYDILENIYREMMEMFRNPDVFHMGGDEVSIACWNSSVTIQNWMRTIKGWQLDELDFIRMWGYFQEQALQRFDRATKVNEHVDNKVPIILWTSRLTEQPFAKMYLDNQRYIIQIWTKGDDPQVEYLLKEGYQLIMSNYEALYFDCGFESWVSDGSNWCGPYSGWHKVYENNLAILGGKYHGQIIGAEAALWSEQADDAVIDARFWPRASALAERLWSDPQSSTWRDAEARMLIHRERLVENGIAAEKLQPQWCLQHEGQCPSIAVSNTNG